MGIQTDALKDTSNQADLALARSQAGGGRFFAAATAAALADLTAPDAVVLAGLIVPNANSRPVTFFFTLQLTYSAAGSVLIDVNAIPNPTSVSGGATLPDDIHVENGGAPVVVAGGTPILIQTFRKDLPADGLTDIITFALTLGIPADIGFTFDVTGTHNLSAMVMDLTVSQQG